MSTVLSHAVTAVAFGTAFSAGGMRAKFWVLSVLCACIPDADVIGFAFGIEYGDFLGHRGFSHSLPFALLLALLVVGFAFRDVPLWSRRWYALIAYFFAITASHGVLDGMTNGGLGIAYFSPFDTTRYFLPWQPLEVPPIGIAAFFSPWGLAVMKSEILWICLPCAGLIAGAWGLRRFRRMRAAPEPLDHP